MDEKFNDLLKRVNGILKPLGYKKEGSNFRLYLPNGICKIFNFQKSKWNTKEHLEFCINAGIYFEKNDNINNLKFKEYDCIIRKRREREKGKFGVWWIINDYANMDEIYESVKIALEEIIRDFEFFSSKEKTIKSVFDGTANNYADPTYLHYYNAKLFAEMGYEQEVYDIIKNIKEKHPYATHVIELADELEERLKNN